MSVEELLVTEDVPTELILSKLDEVESSYTGLLGGKLFGTAGTADE